MVAATVQSALTRPYIVSRWKRRSYLFVVEPSISLSSLADEAATSGLH